MAPEHCYAKGERCRFDYTDNIAIRSTQVWQGSLKRCESTVARMTEQYGGIARILSEHRLVTNAQGIE